MSWILWGLLLLLQNASFTWVSRARNSSSIAYHSLASLCSNGFYILTLGVTVNKLLDAKSTPEFAVVATFYTLITMSGSVGMHHFLMKYVEKGKRKVGS